MSLQLGKKVRKAFLTAAALVCGGAAATFTVAAIDSTSRAEYHVNANKNSIQVFKNIKDPQEEANLDMGGMLVFAFAAAGFAGCALRKQEDDLLLISTKPATLKV